MKKIYSLFILSILALTMFLGCQMPTDGTGNNFEEEAEELPTVNVEYTITIDSPHGTLELNKTKAKAGETVKILKYIADEGYRFKSVNAYKESGELLIDEINLDHTSFVMPSCNVKIVAEYEAISNNDNNDDDDTQIETPTEGEDDNGDGEETEDPVDDTPTETTPTVDPDEATYGFVKTVNYTVMANGQSLPETKTGAEMIAIAKAKNLVKDTDYTINGTTVTLTASGVEKYLGLYSLSVNASEGYLITGGGMKEAGKTVTLSITHRDENDYKTPTELYLVKVSIKEGETDLDIPVTVTKDHKIQFTMPEKKINVFAQFCDIRYELWEEGLDDYKACVTNLSDNKVMLALCFNSKVYDNLEPVDGKYVLKVVNLETNKDMCFTSLCDDYRIGVITTDGLTILESSNKDFVYNPDASQIK